MARAVFEYTQDRLRLAPVPLDHSVPRDELETRAGNLLNAAGNDPQEVLRIFSEVLAPAVISCDSPRFLAFIPAADENRNCQGQSGPLTTFLRFLFGQGSYPHQGSNRHVYRT